MSEIVKICRGKEIIHEFIAEDSFSYKWGLMSDNYINFSLKAKENISLLYGDYILLNSEKFTLFNAVNVTESNGIKEYPLTFYGEQYFVNRCIVEDEGATTFSYFGGASDHMALVKLALDKYGLSRFTLGTIEENGSQLIEYDNTKGLDAISKICEVFKMEWEFAGDMIHIKKRVGVDTSYRFEYGKGKGAYSVGLQPIQNKSITTRVIAKGGTINLPKDYPSTDNPKRLNLGSETLERNTDKYGIIPEVMINEEIYPRLIGKKVVAVEVPADIENATAWKIKLDIPFDLSKQYAPDEKPEVKFQTGDLAGNSFEIVENSWNNEDKTLQIIALDQNGYKLPSVNRQPQIGDEFVLLNILMPTTPYVTDAIKELREWGEKELKIISEPQFAPSLTADPRYIMDNDIQLHPGDGIVVVAGGNEIHIRIQKITFPLTNKRQLALELGNNIMYSYEEKIANDLQDITSEVQNIKRNVHNVDRRGWRDAKETNARLEGIEESAALIGTEGGQLAFTGTFQANVNSNPNSFLSTEGKLQHFIYKDNPTGGIWNIGSFNITLSEDVLHSIYAKCNKSNSNGIIYVSKEKIDIESEEGYYYFFLGTISSIFEQARSVTLVTGYTSITGGYLTGQVIQDARQRLIIDLPNATITAREGATIRGKVEIKSIDDTYVDVEESITQTSQQAADAQKTADEAGRKAEDTQNYIDNTLRKELDQLHDQADGLVERWDGDYIPSISNYPANQWTTEEDKQRHIDDTFTKNSGSEEYLGNSWKWSKVNGTWQWVLIADTALSAALLQSSEAKDIAKTKTRNFVATPYPPYEIGDLWTQGATGDMMQCTTSRLSGSYVASDWAKASKYTDDTVAKQAVERLTAMSSDGIISKEEKAALRNDKSQIDKEFQKYQQDATQYGVSISNLQTAYTTLVNFLVNTIKINDDTDFTFASGQQGDYNQNFANYYAARTSFTNEVANKITENGINNIQIGSLNLLNASGPKDGPWVGDSGKYNIAIFTQTTNIEIGKTYTLVFEGVNTEGDGMIGFWISGSVLQKSWILPKRQVVSFTFVANTAGFVTFYHRPQGASGTSTIYWAMLVEGNKAPKVWSPSISDQEKEAKLGNLFLRGTGRNRLAERAFVLNSDGVNRAKQERGLNLIVVLRENLSISENIVYDTYADAIAAQALTDKLNSLDSSVIVTLTSFDAASNEWSDNLSQAIARCGGSGTKPAHRGPYAFIGIPGIGKGNGIEITTGAGSNDPYAEVSTKIINGIPSGMTSAASILAAKAEEQAELATNKLSDWASDNKISPAEKTGLKQQLANIRAEYTEISNSCDRLSLKSTSYWINYNTAYNAAVAAINKYSAATPEVINIESDYANIAAYYPKRQEISDQITNSDSSGLKMAFIDASKLDPNTYYPVTITATGYTQRCEIIVYHNLGGGTVPPWSTHKSGYSCACKWTTNGSGWGSSNVKRYIESFDFRWTKDDVPPIGSIGQMINSSNEYIYVRGGGSYWVQVKNGGYPSLRSSAFTANEQTISPRSSVIVPVANVDKAQKDADAASQKAITAQKTADTAGTNALQAQKDVNVAVKDAAAALKVAEDAHNDSTAALTEAKNIEFLKAAFGADSTTITGGVVLSSMIGVKNSQNKVVAGLVNGNNPIAKDLMIFAGATSASAMGSAKFRVYSTGKIIATDIEITGGKFMGFELEQEWFTATRGNNKLFISAGDRSLSASQSYANPCITISNGNSNLYLGDPLVQGWMIKLNGNMQHYGGTIETSSIECSKFFAANAAFKTIRTTSGLTITDQVYVNIVSSAIPNVYLPSNPPIGRFVFIRISGSRSIYLRTSDGKQIIISNSPVTSNDNWTRAYGLVLLVWDGTYWNFNQMTY